MSAIAWWSTTTTAAPPDLSLVHHPVPTSSTSVEWSAPDRQVSTCTMSWTSRTVSRQMTVNATAEKCQRHL